MLMGILLQLMCVTHNNLLTTAQHHTVACLDNIVHQHFSPQRQVVVSMPGTEPNLAQRTLLPVSLRYGFEMVDQVLKHMNEKTRFPLLTSQSKFTDILPDTGGMFDDDLYPKVHSYVIFLWTEGAEGNLLASLMDQLNTLRANKYSNNRYRQDMVIVTNQNSQSLAKDLLEFLWKTRRIVNAVILVQRGNELEDPVLDLYTWFPYESGRCTEGKFTLLDQWTEGKFSNNAHLFSRKIPKDLMGCPIRVVTLHYPPFVILTTNYTDVDGSTAYKFRGLEIEYLLLITAAMNLKVEFLRPMESNLEKMSELEESRADVVIGAFSMRFYHLIDGDPTRPYVYTSMKCYTPCPRPIPRMESITRVFMPSVWIAAVLVLALTAAVFWITTIIIFDAKSADFTSYKTYHHCFYMVWAVFLGVSAPAMPRNYQLRALLFIFIWFCFAINTVFQAFFISFLIEPGYEKQIQTPEELREAGIPDLVLDLFMKEFATDNEKAYCRDDECLINLIEKHDIALKTSKHHMQYIASTIGITKDYDKYLCSLYDIISPVMYGMYLTKGSPLLDRFNILIQRCLEGGLGEKYWSNLRWSAILESEAQFMEHGTTDDDMYFVFELSHLTVAFYTLLLGCTCSFTVFLVEIIFDCMHL